MKKLPSITPIYWLIMMSANILGETAGDLITQTLHLGYGGGTIALLILYILAFFIFQRVKNSGVFYWIIIIIASTLGTAISDYLSRSFFHELLGFTENQGYTFSTIFLGFLFGFVFLFGKINKSKKDHTGAKFISGGVQYWSAILISSTLGTAVGDVLAHNTPLGFDGASIVLLILLSVIGILSFFQKIPKILLYWCGVICIHPIGATIGDYMTKPEGSGLGNWKASMILGLVLILIISSVSIRNRSLRHKIQNP